MKKFPMLDIICKLIIALTVGLLEKICIFIYLCLPIWVFMLLMSLRSKNNKATAISAFTTNSSEFQLIFPNFLMVIVEPTLLKKYTEKKVKAVNTFVEKYKLLFLFVSFMIFVACAMLFYFHFLG